MKISYEKIKLELAVTWKISRNSSNFKENFIVTLEDGNQIAHGECAPNIRYGETHEQIEQNLIEISSLSSLDDLKNYMNKNVLAHSLECAINNAIYKLSYNSDEEILKSFKLEKRGPFKTSFSIPIMDLNEIKDYIEKNNSYDVYKIKITNLADLKIIHEVRKHTDKAIRIDANEGFSDTEEYLNFDHEIKDLNVEFVEQPFPAHNVSFYQDVKERVYTPLMGDESLEKQADFNLLASQFHSINIKLQKCGGIVQAHELINEAKKHNLKIMIGCMIETSLGIKDALYLGSLVNYLDLDGSLLLKRDPYNLIQLKDGHLYF